MTTKDYIKKLNKVKRELRDARVIFPAVTTVHARVIDRTFVKGENSTGGKIGYYNDTKELYVNPINVRKGFTPEGKPGRQRNIQNRKSRWFRSYKSFRDHIGRETNFVNLRLNEDLKSDYTNSLARSGASYFAGVARAENSGKVEGAVKKYGITVFQASKPERMLFRKLVTKIIKDKL